MKDLDVVAVGACYVDTSVGMYPFDSTGIPPDSELVGGAYEVVAGGSAVNFCRLLGTLGLRTAFIGLAGIDANAGIMEQSLRDHDVQPFIARKEGLTTNIGFNVTNSAGQHIMLVAGTANAALDLDGVHEQVNMALEQSNMLYIGGCFKLLSLAPDFAALLETARSKSAQVVVDHGRIPAQFDESLAEHVRNLVLGATYYFPSRDEFCALWGVDTIDDGLQLLRTRAPNWS